MEKHEVSPYNDKKLHLSMGVVSYWIFISFVFTNLVFCDAFVKNEQYSYHLDKVFQNIEEKGNIEERKWMRVIKRKTYILEIRITDSES